MKTVRLLSIIIGIGVMAWWLIWGCAEDTHKPPTGPVSPLSFIDTTYPQNEAVDVPLGSIVYISFLRPMDVPTLTGNKFHLNNDQIYSFSCNDKMAKLTPCGLLHRGVEYEIVIDSGIADTFGNVMATPYRFSFKTVTGSDFIADISPGEGEEGVSTHASVSVTFTRPVDYSTITDSTFFIAGVSGSIIVNGRTVTLKPDTSLLAGQRYTVTLKSTVADTAGTMLGLDYIWYFTTAANTSIQVVSVSPVDGATEVPRNTDISIKFSREIVPASVTVDEFTVSGGVTGAVSCLGSTVLFNPAADLLPESTYTAHFDGSVTSTFGGQDYIDHQWSFTTAAVDTFPPYVVSIYPEDGGWVFKEDTISITFSENILPASVSPDEFIVRFSSGGTIGGEVSVSGATVRFVPDHDLLVGWTLVAEFIGDVYDLNGNKADIDYTWSFIVTDFRVIERYPTTGCVPLNARIIMVCFGTVDPQTVSPDDFVFNIIDGDTLSGTVRVAGDTMLYTPDVPLESLTRYRMAIVGEIKDVEGHILSLKSAAWSFSTKGENLLPLEIGNKWIYHVNVDATFPSPVHQSYDDSIAIVGDTMIDGVHFYRDQIGRIYRYEDDVIETTFMFRSSSMVGTFLFDNTDCANGSVSTIATGIGAFTAELFSLSYSVLNFYQYHQGFYFAPGVGLVKFSQKISQPCSGCDEYTYWTLIGYELH
jgi:hypothetical protein